MLIKQIAFGYEFESTHLYEDDSARLLLSEHARETNASLKWGPYRPNLYMGIRPRGLPQSFLSGLMWYNVDSYSAIQKTRHSCEQSDEMSGYGWETYDTRDGGRQVMHDTTHKVDITTEFVKDGASWGLRVKGKPTQPDVNTAVVFYFGTEGLSESHLATKFSDLGYLQDTAYGGFINDLGKFDLTVTRGPASNQGPPDGNSVATAQLGDRIHARSLTVDPATLWKAKEYYMKITQDRIEQIQRMITSRDQLPIPSQLFNLNDDGGQGNLHFVQRNFMGEFQFDILFNGQSETPLTSAKVTHLLESAMSSFDNRYSEVFAPSAPYNTAEHIAFGKALISNVMGGIGYFHGSSLVDRSEGAYDDEEEENFWLNRGPPEITETEPLNLFSGVPSRPFFPRGFYWDEGFHLIPTLKWDPDLGLEILKSWFKLTDDEGWIAREQILGHEARSKVPQEFQTQIPTFANPPTLIIALEAFVEQVESSSTESKHGMPVGDDMPQQFINFPEFSPRTAYLRSPALARAAVKSMYPTLKLHYNWFRRTQSADIKAWHDPNVARPMSWTEGYRWRGRTPNHCLTSGLDDYPRALPPHPAEMHVDLLAWMGSMTRSMIKIGSFVGAPVSEIKRYKDILTGIQGNLEDLHWSEEAGLYCDLGWNAAQETRTHECHEGYVSLIPFMVGLVPSDRVGSIVKKIRDPDGLWSNHGIRSLSLRDSVFGTDENYWRGSVWIHMNYMILTALENYYDDPDIDSDVRSLMSDTYQKLRVNIVDTVFKEWQETGFAFEQYEQATGKGKGVKHFLGWTSLTTMIMNMPERLN
ncbi:glycoside hydrolase [Lipomyces arxii]|uniref:glycoside hydrolase n=1 Tax=Lipomyces arxii TaxID=56418 RepID=UPI0034CDBC81